MSSIAHKHSLIPTFAALAPSALAGAELPANAASPGATIADLPGLRDLWARTLGDPEICIAVLDGPVDLAHPSLAHAQLTQIESLVPPVADANAATEHGTHVASVIFGSHDGPIAGMAPRCRGVSIPIFAPAGDDSFQLCSQVDLTRAIGLAVQHGAHVINISGGEFSPSGAAYPLLEDTVRQCARAGILIVAAAGNQGCECLHVPAGIETVLAVGAMDVDGLPLEFSNWGGAYQKQGILAPAVEILGAVPGGGSRRRTGTSYAAPVVSGLAALLLSLQRLRGEKPDPAFVRAALLETALDCSSQPAPDCRRLLAGRLNVRGAVSFIMRSNNIMDQTTVVQASGIAPEHLDPALMQTEVEAQRPPRLTSTPTAPQTPPQAEQAPAKSCGCGGKAAATAPQLVYALGQLGYDLMTEARCDSLAQKMAGLSGGVPQRGLAFDHEHMLGYLQKNPWDAASIEWTLTLEGTPVYAVRPQGPFAAHAYECLREFLAEQEAGKIERVSIPGMLSGKARLLNGQTVPVLVPELRGMYSWTTSAMVNAVVGPGPSDGAATDGHVEYDRKRAGVHNFLQRVYHGVRNLGIMPQERAVNFTATNAFEVGEIYQAALKDRMELDTVNVVRSPVCRPESDCWDVELYFFYPDRQVQTVRRVYRFTVDVSDVVPVTVGATRSWFTR